MAFFVTMTSWLSGQKLVFPRKMRKKLKAHKGSVPKSLPELWQYDFPLRHGHLFYQLGLRTSFLKSEQE